MNQRRIVASGPTFSGVAEIEAQEYRTFFYKLRFCRCRGCVAELHRETTDYYTTSFADSRRGKSGMVGFGTIGIMYSKYFNYVKIFFALRAAWNIGSLSQLLSLSYSLSLSLSLTNAQ